MKEIPKGIQIFTELQYNHVNGDVYIRQLRLSNTMMANNPRNPSDLQNKGLFFTHVNVHLGEGHLLHVSLFPTWSDLSYGKWKREHRGTTHGLLKPFLRSITCYFQLRFLWPREIGAGKDSLLTETVQWFLRNVKYF